MLLQVPGHQRFNDGPVVGVEMAHGDEVLDERPALVERPGLEGPDEPGLVDQAILQGEQTDEEIAVGIGQAMTRSPGRPAAPEGAAIPTSVSCSPSHETLRYDY